MDNGKAKLDLYSKHHEHWFFSHVKKIEDAKKDKGKKERLQLQQCPYCFYLSSGFGGSAMTSWECALCTKTGMNGSTNTPTLCEECSVREDRCRLCGDKMFETKRTPPNPQDHYKDNHVESMKRDYWKVVCEEYPGGIYCETRKDALEMSRELRTEGEKAYVRKIRETELEHDERPEI